MSEWLKRNEEPLIGTGIGIAVATLLALTVFKIFFPLSVAWVGLA